MKNVRIRQVKMCNMLIRQFSPVDIFEMVFKKTTLVMKNAFILVLFLLGNLGVGNICYAQQVTSSADSGAGTLRQAIADASEGSTITFNGVSTITLTSGQLDLNKALTIDGGTGVTIERNTSSVGFRIFSINAVGTVSMSNLTIKNGKLSSIEDGGGIYANADLELDSCVFQNNEAGDDGGAVYMEVGKNITARYCIVNGNSAGWGGGIYVGSNADILNCEFSNNTVSTDGGAIRSGTEAVNTTITNCTFSGNTAGTDGGAIGVYTGSVSIVSSTITRNTSTSGSGGGIQSDPGGSISLLNTIIAGNTNPGGRPDIAGSTTSNGYNLIGNVGSETFTSATGDIVGSSGTPIDAKLGVISNNGGITRTIPLLNGSPAIEAGTLTGTPTLDQIGQSRSGTIDIGAFEVQNPVVTYVSSSTSDGTYIIGNTVAIEVNFNKSVTVTNTPQLEVETGTTDRQAVYVSGSPGSTLVFEYEVQSGDSNSDLDYTSVNALTLNGGSIQNGSTNAYLALPEPGANNSLGANKDLVIEGVAPIISSLGLNNSNAYLEIFTNEGVYSTNGGSGALEISDIAISLSGGNATNPVITSLKKVDGTTDLTGGEKIIRVNFTTTGMANGSEIITINFTDGNSVFDVAGNAAAAIQTNNTRTLNDLIDPFITGVNLASDNTYIDVTFNEGVYKDDKAIDGLEASDFDLKISGGSATSPVISSVKQNDNADESLATALSGGETIIRIFFSVTGTPDGSETLEVDLHADEVYDVNSRKSVAEQTSDNTATLNDVVAPTVVISTTSSDPTNDDPILIMITFNEEVDLFNSASLISVSGATFSNFASSDSITFTVNPIPSGDGTISISVSAGVTTDLAGNANAASNTLSLNYDGTAPRVTSIERQTLGSSSTNADVVTFRVTFNEDVKAVDFPDFEVTGPTGAAIGVSGVGDTYDISISGGNIASYNGVVTLGVSPSQNITDFAGNSLTNTTPTGTNNNTYILDNIAPTVSSLIPADNAIDVNLSTDFTITFSENVVVKSGNLTVRRLSDDAEVSTFDVTNTPLVSVSGNMVTFANTTDLALITDYYILLDNGAFEDEAGNAFGGIVSTTDWGFTTANQTKIAINDPSLTEGNTGTHNLTFTVSLSQPAPPGGVTVDYATVDGTATAGSDYTAASGTLGFATDETSKTIDVVVSGDLMLEPDETITITLTNPTGTYIAVSDGTGTGIITNDDNASLTIADVSGNEDDGAITVTAVLDNPVAGGFSVNYASADGTATSSDDYTSVSGTLTFAGTLGESQEFTIVPTADLIDEGDETISISLASLSGTVLPVSISDEATITILDDDNTPVITTGQTFSIDETIVNGHEVGTILATDTDAGTTFSNWTITEGNGDGIFAINSSTGEITVTDNTKLDYETKTSYSLTVTVSDGTNTSAGETVTVNVNNINDNTPVVTASQSFNVNEDAANTTSVGTVAATDADAGTTLSDWTITGGNGDGIFAINSSTGEITVTDNTKLDYETRTSYYLTVTVSDGSHTSSSETISITVNDVFEKSDQNITFSQLTDLTYGDSDFNLTATASSGLPVSYSSSNTSVATINGNTVTIMGAGSTTITASQSGNASYNAATDVQQGLIVMPRALTIMADDKTKVYDGMVYSPFTVSYAGFVTGEDDTDLGGALTFSGTATTATDVKSDYVITPRGLISDNYAITFVDGTLSITKAAQIVTFNEIPLKHLETDPDFNLDATSSSGLAVTYSYSHSSTTAPAEVSPTGFVSLLASGEVEITASQEGDNNYLPAEPVTRTMIIESSDANIHSVTINGVTYNSPDQEIYYLIDCNDEKDKVGIDFSTEANATGNTGLNFEIETPTPGIYRKEIQVTSQDDTNTRTYRVVVVKRFNYEDIVIQKYNNVLLVNNNPETNGGYRFTSFNWYKDGVLIGTGQYYSVGDNASDQLDLNAMYSVEMETEDGDILSTCESSITLKSAFVLKVAPNPVHSGSTIDVTTTYSTEMLTDLKITVSNLYGLQVMQEVSGSNNSRITLPSSLTPGTYVVSTKAGGVELSTKIIVQ